MEKCPECKSKLRIVLLKEDKDKKVPDKKIAECELKGNKHYFEVRA